VKQRVAGKVTDLPVPKLCFECVPVPGSPSCVDSRPIDNSDWMAKDLENRVLLPIHAGIIPHAVEAWDVVRKGGSRWRRDILGSERDGVAVAKPQYSCLVTCHARASVWRYRSRKAVGWKKLRCCTVM
jgi:hypothetical protein